MNQKENYKTSLCRHYMKKGVCSLYEQCHFAHGRQELRRKGDPQPMYIPPECKPVSIYKTQLCTYFMNGFCRNGAQCSFAHGQADMKGMIVVTDTPYHPPPCVPPPQHQRQPPQPSPPTQPDYGQAGEFLHSILRNLEQVFPDDIQKKVLISKGMELVESQELPEANDIINELVHSTNLTEEQKQQCHTILTNAYSLHKVNSFPF